MSEPSSSSSGRRGSGALIADQIAYYRARAGEYDESLRKLERYISLGGNVAGDGSGDEAELTILLDALERLTPFDRVLELACGTGWWTQWLARHAQHVTAVDAADEMLALNRERVNRGNVRYVLADIFSWKPDGRFDLVFFAFWLSHVPQDRFAAFWQLVRDTLTPDGRVFFIDELDTERSRALETRLDKEAVLRRLDDGRQFRAVKILYQPSTLEAKLRQLRWDVDVRPAGHRFYWGQSAL
jgi:2-polyprenyl-3-methyl-5-hydroxy-6-metoxy-1,4-benzoquinol methylase